VFAAVHESAYGNAKNGRGEGFSLWWHGVHRGQSERAAWPTLGEESSVIHRMPRRHAVSVALRHRLHGPTVVQWRQAVSMPEGIDRISQRGRPAGRDGGKPKKYGENAIKRELHGLRPSLSCRR
jgi:hypothetical protein